MADETRRVYSGLEAVPVAVPSLYVTVSDAVLRDPAGLVAELADVATDEGSLLLLMSPVGA